MTDQDRDTVLAVLLAEDFAIDVLAVLLAEDFAIDVTADTQPAPAMDSDDEPTSEWECIRCGLHYRRPEYEWTCEAARTMSDRAAGRTHAHTWREVEL